MVPTAPVGEEPDGGNASLGSVEQLFPAGEQQVEDQSETGNPLGPQDQGCRKLLDIAGALSGNAFLRLLQGIYFYDT